MGILVTEIDILANGHRKIGCQSGKIGVPIIGLNGQFGPCGVLSSIDGNAGAIGAAIGHGDKHLG